jgi:enoyl-CoA hydratase/carnithine racemase
MMDLALELSDEVAVITFNRPERLNAFRRTTYTELRALVERLDRERAWRALVLTGAGRAFCAGQDLQDVPREHVEIDPRHIRAVLDDIQGITRALATAEKPSVCAINGPAVGFGLEVTLGCDLRFATPEAYFMLPELAHGLFHTNATYHFLPELAGPGLAADMILTGRRVSAEEAVEAGLVSRTVPAAELLSTSMTVARGLAAVTPRALALARRALRESRLRVSLDAALEFETSACLELLGGGEARPR